MRKIIIVAIVLVFTLPCSCSLLFAADIVHREGNDLVVYKQVEDQRYKNVPKEVPGAEAIKIMQKGKGEYSIPRVDYSFSYQLAFPIIQTEIITKTVMCYQSGSWRKTTVVGSPLISNEWCSTLLLFIFPMIALLLIGIANQRTCVGDMRLLLPYCLIMVTPFISDWVRFWELIFRGHAGLIGAITIICMIGCGILGGVYCCTGEQWRAVAIASCIMAVLMEIIGGVVVVDKMQGSAFLDRLAFLAWSCLGSYILAKLVERMFFSGKKPSFLMFLQGLIDNPR